MFTSYYEKTRIQHQLCQCHMLQQNGVAKHMNMCLLDNAYSIML